MIKLILTLTFLLFQRFLAEKIICNTSHTVSLKKNEIVFFESPNFPESIDNSVKKNCSLTIYGFSQNKNMRLIFAITNGNPIGAQISDEGNTQLLEFPKINFYVTNSTSITFSFANNVTNQNEEGFRGYITYEEEQDYSCPLSNKKNPFIFTDESEVLYIRSGYNNNLEHDTFFRNEKQCVWNFLAPKGYGFKIHSLYTAETIAVPAAKVLVEYNDKKLYLQSLLPHFYNTQNITITFTTAYENIYEAPKFFFARISIINLFKNSSNENCLFEKNGSLSEWHLPNLAHPIILKCQKNFTIQPKHQLYARIIDLETKENVDVLRYYIDEELLHPVQISKMQLYAFLPFNETERNITFEYSNEETLTYKGFKVEFEDVECKCKYSKFIIPCTDEFNYTIMGRENDYNYCADLSCDFEILINESCKNNEIYLKVFKNIDDPFNDTLIVKSDNYTILNTTGIYKRTYKGEMQNALILHNRKTTMKFQSSSYFNGYKSFPIGSIRLLMKAINEVTRLPKEIITADKLLYTYESEKFPENSVLTIELSKELSAYGDILKMFYETSNIQHLMTCLTFYTDDEMKNVYEYNPYSTVSIINQSITIYKHIECNTDITKLYIKAKKTPSNKCIFQKNIINIEDGIKRNNKFSMVSSSKSSCELILINNVGNYAIKGIMTKSRNNLSIEIYNSAKMDDPILKLDYYSAPKWKLMTFNALSYLIIIPPKTSVLFEFYDLFNVINITEPLLSYYETPYFGTLNFKPIISNTTYQISTNLEANFTVSDIHLSFFGILQIIFSDGNVRNLTTKGDIITIALKEGQLFDIYYNEPEPGYKGAMINIEVFRKQFQKVIL